MPRPLKKAARRPTRKCCVANCSSTEADKIMLVVPKDEPRLKKWEKAVGNSLKGLKDCVCEDHFLLEEDAENWVKYRLMPGTKLALKKTAVPHRFGHSSSQSQFPGYTERVLEKNRLAQSKSCPQKKKVVGKKKQDTNRRNEPDPEPDPIEFPGTSYSSESFDGNLRAVPCTCEAGRRLLNCHPTSDSDDPDACLEPEVTIKEEPEEYADNFDFPVVIVKEEPVWGGIVPEDPQFKVKEEPPDEDDGHSPYETSTTYDDPTAPQYPGSCLIHRHNTPHQAVGAYNQTDGKSIRNNGNSRPVKHHSENYGCIELDSSDESEISYLSSPSSPPSPVHDSDADPEFKVELEKMEESTDDEKLEYYDTPKLIPDGIYNCYWCNKKFRFRRWFKCHLYREHSGEKPYACNKCDFRATTTTGLRDHKYTQHSSKRRFICDVCKKRYATRTLLWAHKSHVHRSEKRYACANCDFKTNYNEKLKIHNMRHTGEKPKACTFCEARFRHQNALKTHMLIHTGEKPYACDRCDYRCRQSGMLTAHKRVHHPEGSEDDS